MQTAWTTEGHDIEQFWRLTPRETSIVLLGDRRRFMRQQQLVYYGAFFSGVFSQPHKKGRFPSYEKYAPNFDDAGQSKKVVRASWQEQKAIAQSLNFAFGGKFETKGKTHGE